MDFRTELELEECYKKISELEYEIKHTNVPSQTLSDIEKIEFLKKHWYDIDYNMLVDMLYKK